MGVQDSQDSDPARTDQYSSGHRLPVTDHRLTDSRYGYNITYSSVSVARRLFVSWVLLVPATDHKSNRRQRKGKKKEISIMYTCATNLKEKELRPGRRFCERAVTEIIESRFATGTSCRTVLYSKLLFAMTAISETETIQYTRELRNILPDGASGEQLESKDILYSTGRNPFKLCLYSRSDQDQDREQQAWV